MNSFCGSIVKEMRLNMNNNECKTGVELSSRCCTRNSSLELLRIISMIMIVFYHYACHGGFEWSTNELTVPHFWYNFISMGGKVGVDVFVLISGFFLIDSRVTLFNFSKVIKLWGEIFFYALTILILSWIFGLSDLSIKSIIIACFPITIRTWWFASTYLVLYVLHPFLNKFLNRIDKKVYQKYLVIIIIMWSVIPTFTTREFEGNNLIWFITLYSISGYIRKYDLNAKFNKNGYLMFFILFSFLTYVSSIVLTIMGSKWSVFGDYSTYFYGYEKLSVLLISITLFMYFKSMEVKNNKLINIIASATFGVYLISDNYTIQKFLWNDLFKNSQFQHSSLLIIHSIVAVSLVYIICTVIDLVRQATIEKKYVYLTNKYEIVLLKPFVKLIDFFTRLIFG